MSAHAHGATGADVERLDKSVSGKLVTMAAVIAAAGVLACGAALASDAKRFYFSYLTGFAWVLTLGLGGLFFVIIQHLVRAGWSVAARRQMEWLAGVLQLAAVLFIPIILGAHDLFHHWMSPEAAQDPILIKKAGYLNTGFFYTRAVIFLVAWFGLSWFFRAQSRAQDDNGNPEHTLRMQAFSAPAVLVFALSLTFAAFDWLMSLDPHWYSTIFGVYIFAGSATSSLSALALMTIALQRAGIFKSVSTVEHQHDIGKLLFGFTVFWAYIAFSQFFLIWYANIPEETIFFRHRWEEGWRGISILLMLGHFVIPFALLLSRTAKRSRLLLGIGAVWMLLMHYVDLYWLVMPNLDPHGAHFHWIDVAGLLGPAGILLLWLAIRASRDPVYPLKDPRLTETKLNENL
ncbi:MAG: hypothetical protein AB2A00_29805 [Myxococcota bacterium]